MPEVTTVRFDGDNLQTVREGERVWVVVKRVCEVLGVDHSGQIAKLKGTPWASMEMISTDLQDGRNYEMFCVDLDTLPMWLATIDVGRVRPEAREKLIAYQRECARVLRDHFFGRAAPQPSTDETHRAVLAIVEPLVTAISVRVDAELWNLRRRVNHVEKHAVFGPSISQENLEALKRDVKSVALIETLARLQPNTKAAVTSLYSEMSKRARWGARGQPWHALPFHREEEAREVLRCRRATAEKLLGSVAQRSLDFEQQGISRKH